MPSNKFQRSRLTFDLSAWSPINILEHSFFHKPLAHVNSISCEDSLLQVSHNLYKILRSPPRPYIIETLYKSSPEPEGR